MNDEIHNLAVADTIACFTPHDVGVKEYEPNPNELEVKLVWNRA